MPEFPPEYADLSAPRLSSWIPPRTVTIIAPDWRLNTIVLPSQPVVLYENYVWDTNDFLYTSERLTNQVLATQSGAVKYTPVILTIEGEVATDRTDYRSNESPQMADYEVTRRVEYYLDGKRLHTNVEFERLNIDASTVIVKYTHITDAVALEIELRAQGTSGSDMGPAVDAYTIHMSPRVHPQSS